MVALGNRFQLSFSVALKNQWLSSYTASHCFQGKTILKECLHTVHVSLVLTGEGIEFMII